MDMNIIDAGIKYYESQLERMRDTEKYYALTYESNLKEQPEGVALALTGMRSRAKTNEVLTSVYKESLKHFQNLKYIEEDKQ